MIIPVFFGVNNNAGSICMKRCATVSVTGICTSQECLRHAEVCFRYYSATDCLFSYPSRMSLSLSVGMTRWDPYAGNPTALAARQP